MGAAGRDFHNFNCYFRGNKNYQVVAFTAEQISGISGRRYPKQLAGPGYTQGIPIYPEKKLTDLIKKYNIDQVVLAYSDLPYDYVMHRAAIVNAAGADFILMGLDTAQLKSKRPLLAVCAVRTGCGKSQTSRAIAKMLYDWGIPAAVIRHPMPYGDLLKQTVQKFSHMEDLKKHKCTIEEMEEYEPYIDMGLSIYAGVDYGQILKEAEKEAKVIIWDGGNNDFSFYKSDFCITVADPLRAGHELKYYPGEVNFRVADVIMLAKSNSATPAQLKEVIDNAKAVNPKAKVIKGRSKLTPEEKVSIRNKRVLVIEDGPTVTHGEMPIGAGWEYAKKAGAKIVKPRAQGAIKKILNKYTHLKEVLPAMGYSVQEIRDLERTIKATPCDVVVSATPINLKRLVKIDKPFLHVKYENDAKTDEELKKIVKSFLIKKRLLK